MSRTEGVKTEGVKSTIDSYQKTSRVKRRLDPQILEQEESVRVFKLTEKFINAKGAAIAFQKNAWNGLRSEKDAEYSIGAAREARLKGTLKGHNDLALSCVPPTRLAGPCRSALTQMFENC